jgi:PAS domain S-box-containing protein
LSHSASFHSTENNAPSNAGTKHLDNPKQQKRLDQALRLIGIKLEELSTTISLLKTQGLEQALRLVRTDKGKENMDNLRVVISEMIKEENELLKERNLILERNQKFTLVCQLMGTFLLILIGIIVMLKVRGLLALQSKTVKGIEEREGWFRELLESAPDATIVVDAEGVIKLVNKQTNSLFGYTSKELIGERIEILVPEAARGGHIAHRTGYTQSALARPMGKEIELSGQAKSGRVFSVEVSLSPIQTSAGQQVAASVRDITERKLVEEELFQQREILRNVLDSVSQGIVKWSADQKLVSWNNHFQHILDLPDEFMEEGYSLKKVSKFVAERGDYGEGDPEELANNRIEFLMRGKASRIEATFGENIYDVDLQPAEDGGITITYSEITDRKRMEVDLVVSKEKAEAATKAKASFLASMSHEIRTPMNGVVGMADLLSQTSLDDDQVIMLNTIRDSGNSLLTVINDILDFSKIEAGKLAVEAVPLSMIDVLEGAVATISPNASRKNIQIVSYVDPEIPQNLLGDPVRLRQIIFNLTGNAVKFSEEGEVTVRADLLPTDGDEIRVRISVIDNGIGISQEAQNKLFDAFSQADNSTTRRFGGTGLGLTICKSLTELMGGDMFVESEIGSGSTFSVELPLLLGSENEATPKDLYLNDVRLLIITNSEMLGFVVQQYLEHWGANVKTVSGEAAREYDNLNNTIFDVVVSDFNLKMGDQQNIVEKFRSDQTRFISMTDGQRRSARIQSSDIIALDGNPLRYSQLLTAVAVAVGRASPLVRMDIDDTTSKTYIPLSVEEALAQGTLILLAEDNITNQNVIQRQLKMLGYTCEIADDGKLALKAWQQRDYRLLLSDCHMPHMDGFELTAAIRNTEEGTGKRAPIIAVTANALEGEAQRCIAEGMDDYLSKPLKMDDLKAMLRKWMPEFDPIEDVEPDVDVDREDAAPAPEPVPADSAGEASNDRSSVDGEGNGDVRGNSAIDPSALKSVFGDDDETFKEILKDFVDPATSNVEEIETAFADRSADSVAKAAHKLKSSARSVGANDLADLCQTLESAGKAEDWDEIDKVTPRLPSIIQKVVEYVNKL